MHATTVEHKMRFIKLVPLLLVILLDVVGVILVIPVITPLILQSDSGLVPADTSELMRDALFGVALSLYPIFMFFSTPILGDLSDKFGRKKILMICLVFSSVSYLVTALGIDINNLGIVLFSRILGGLAAGTQSIATAAIIDLSVSNTKAYNLSWVVFIDSVGLILGPVLGGVTADSSIVSWFDYTTPFYIAAFLALLNLIFLYFFLECYPSKKVIHKIQITKGFRLFMSAFTKKKFRLLSILFSCYILAWSIYFQSINFYLAQKFNYNSTNLGLFVGFIGFLLALSSLFFSKWVRTFFGRDTTTYAVSITAMGIACLGAALFPSELSQWLWVILLAISEVICFAISLSLFSNLVDEDSQGWIMGVNSALGAIIWGLGAFLAGPLGYIALSLPFWVSSILCLTSGGLMLIYKKCHD